MKKSFALLLLMVAIGCTRGANDPAEQALVQMNRAVLSGQSETFLERLSPSMLREVSTRLGLPKDSQVTLVAERIVLVPSVGFEKLRSFKPKLIPERSGHSERWYRVQLGELKLQVPVKKFGEDWRVALNEALFDG